MKVLFVGSAASIHSHRWISGLTRKGLRLHMVTAEQPAFDFPCDVTVAGAEDARPGKIRSLAAGVRQIRADFAAKRMDVLHCHYAGRYGVWGALSAVHPFLVSIWGSDILLNPHKSILHRTALGWMLRRADHLQSTSQNMAKAAWDLYGLKGIAIVPFGIDTEKFTPLSKSPSPKVRIIAIKSLESVYGFDVLIRAIAAINRQGDFPEIECSIYGKGSQQPELEGLVQELGLRKVVAFKGRIEQDKVPQLLSNADLAIYPSRSESFGVSALEAMACGCPVIVSDAPGHVEVTGGVRAARIFPRGSVDALASEIRASIANKEETLKRAALALSHVRANYSWNDSLDVQIRNYEQISAKRLR
jgi:L-malate glycosyltransferase